MWIAFTLLSIFSNNKLDSTFNESNESNQEGNSKKRKISSQPTQQ
jgi:hypothetical protein